MSMDEFLLGFHGRHPPAARGDAPRVSVTRMRTAAKAWEEVPGQGGLQYRDAAAGGEVTLGDFRARNGAAMRAEGVAAPLPRHEKAGFLEDPVTNGRFHEQEQQSLLQIPMPGSGNGVASGGGGEGRTRKRPALDDLVDKVDLRRQKRMIKNRESAARSRQRKQAYTLELESLVLKLEEENAILLSEQEEQHEMRIHQLMENVIPITEKRKPSHILRRIHSMSW